MDATRNLCSMGRALASSPSKKSPVLLIIDGHTTHARKLEVKTRARQNRVHISILLPHCSHRLQLLGRVIHETLEHIQHARG